MADNGLVTRLKVWIEQDSRLDRADLHGIGLDAEKLQWSPAAIGALNQVLDELFTGKFQSPTCYRIAADAVSDLRIFSHYLTKEVRDYLPVYLQKEECTESAINPETVAALLRVAHDETIPTFNKVRATYLKWQETVLQDVDGGLAIPSKEVREEQWQKYTDAYATVIGLQQQALAIRQRAQDTYKGFGSETARLLDNLIGEIHDIQLLDETQVGPQALEQQCLRLQLKPLFTRAVEIGPFVRMKRFPHESLGGLLPKEMPLCSNDPAVKAVIYFVKGRSPEQLEAVLRSPMGLKDLLPYYETSKIRFSDKGLRYNALPILERHSFCLSFSVLPVNKDWSAIVYQPNYVDAGADKGRDNLAYYGAEIESKRLWYRLQQFGEVAENLNAIAGKIDRAELLDKEPQQFAQEKATAFAAYDEIDSHNEMVEGVSFPTVMLGLGAAFFSLFVPVDRDARIGMGVGGLAVAGAGFGLMFGLKKDEETTKLKYQQFEEVEKWHEWLKEQKPPASTGVPGTTIFSWAGQF